MDVSRIKDVSLDACLYVTVTSLVPACDSAHMLFALVEPVSLCVCCQQLSLHSLQPLPQVLDLLLCKQSPLYCRVLELRLLAQLLADVTQPGLHLWQRLPPKKERGYLPLCSSASLRWWHKLLEETVVFIFHISLWTKNNLQKAIYYVTTFVVYWLIGSKFQQHLSDIEELHSETSGTLSACEPDERNTETTHIVAGVLTFRVIHSPCTLDVGKVVPWFLFPHLIADVIQFV